MGDTPHISLRAWLAAGVGLVGLVMLIGATGMRWRTTVRLSEVQVSGIEHADSSEVLRLASIKPDTLLYRIDTAIVADRVRRHPWVEESTVRRVPTGRLLIDVKERTPVLLVVNRQGQPAYFVDAYGFRMPAVRGAGFDVPILWGLEEPYGAVLPVSEARVRELAAILPDLENDVDALLSEFEMRDTEVILHTTAWPGRSSISVRLGQSGFESRIRRLHAFWHQVVLAEPDGDVRSVDLRFDSQIITS